MKENNQSELPRLFSQISDAGKLWLAVSSVADGESLADEEIPEFEFELRRALDDEDNAEFIRERWASYHAIGSMLRGEASKGVDISAAVRAAIESEVQPQPELQSQSQSQPQSIASRRFFKPLSQFAMAASVAAFALFGVQQYQTAQLENGSAGDNVVEVEVTDPSSSNGFTAPIGFEARPQTSTVSNLSEVSNVGREDLILQIQIERSEADEHTNENGLRNDEAGVEPSRE